MNYANCFRPRFALLLLLIIGLSACDPSAKWQGVYTLDMNASAESLKEITENKLPGRFFGALMLGLAGAVDLFIIVEKSEINVVVANQLFAVPYEIRGSKIVITTDNKEILIAKENGFLVLYQEGERSELPLLLKKEKEEKRFREKWEGLKK